MNKRINALENQLLIQKENLNKMSSLANKKQEKLNYDIFQYQKQINDLKNELESLNSTITNLTEEKENNTIKLTELIHENEELKKTKIQNENIETQNKKYENIIIKLKKNINKLTEEKKSLEEVIIKQEQKVTEFSSKVDQTKKEILKKDKELQESIEYNAKLTNTINFHKKEIQKLKQSNSTTVSTSGNNNSKNNNNKDVLNIMNLQKEIQSVKKEIETKDNKINLLTMNNKILQGKVNKLSQTTKNGFNNMSSNNNPEANNTNTNTDINNNLFSLGNKDIRSSLINPKKSDIISDSRKCFIIAKPKKSAHIIGLGNYGRQNSTSIRVKNDILTGNNNRPNLEENNSLYNIINKNNKNVNGALKKGQKRNNSNIANIKKNNNITNANSLNNGNNILPVNNIPNMNANNIGNNINININNINYINSKDNQMKLLDLKYKEIESKYKKDTKNIKDETLFGEEILDNFDLNEEIITSQTLKPKKKRNLENNEQSLNTSQEKDFQIIESYCLLSGAKNDTIDGNLNLNTSNGNNISKNIRDKDESKIIEKKKIQELHNHVQKILDEFN